MTTDLSCSMCGHSFGTPAEGADADVIIVKGMDGGICEPCVRTCGAIISQAKRQRKAMAFVVPEQGGHHGA